MKPIRVLVVDDTALVRRMVTESLSGDPSILVVGAAANGRQALEMISRLNPDLVTLDIEMPEMDGLETLKVLRSSHPKLPVIMFSSLTQRGAAATLDALALGAQDYVTKPSNTGDPAATMATIRDELVPRIKGLVPRQLSALCSLHRQGLAVRQRGRPTPSQRAESREQRAGAQRPIEIVAIGASTGGPNALLALFAAIPPDFPVPIVMVQHMPPVFTRSLAERLTARAAIPVREAKLGETLHSRAAWLAPGGYHMAIANDGATGRLRVHQGPPENSCRPAVDVLFRSVAEVYGAATLAVVLTGMGQDGLRGCKAIAAAGGRILVQDEASSVIWGMPGVVHRAGLSETALPLNALGNEIVRRVRESRSFGSRVPATTVAGSRT